MGNFGSGPAHVARVIRKYIPSGREADVGLQLDPVRSARTVESWRLGEHTPGGWDLLQLFGILGSDFQNEITAPVGTGAARYVNGEVSEQHFLAVATNYSAKHAAAAADGHIDHNEAREVLAAVEPLVAMAPEMAHKMRKKVAA